MILSSCTLDTIQEFSLGVRPSLVRLFERDHQPKVEFETNRVKRTYRPCKINLSTPLQTWQEKLLDWGTTCRPCGNRRRSWLVCKLRFKGREKRLFIFRDSRRESESKEDVRSVWSYDILYKLGILLDVGHHDAILMYIYTMYRQERQSGLYGEEECNQTAANCF